MEKHFTAYFISKFSINGIHHWSLSLTDVREPQLTLSLLRQKFRILGSRLPIRSFIRRYVVVSLYPSTQLSVSNSSDSFITCNSMLTVLSYESCLMPDAQNLTRTRFQNIQGIFRHFYLFQYLSNTSWSGDRLFDWFIAVYKLFTKRRGICSTITITIVAPILFMRILIYTVSSRPCHRNGLASHLANGEITWKFNSPLALYFGRKWEAGMK